jgi:hypothetical protein
MSYNTYRGIETASICMSDAIRQMRRLEYCQQGEDEGIAYDDDTPPNEYEMAKLPNLVNACVSILELYLEAVNNGYIEDVAEIDLTVLKDAIETFEL